MSTQEISGPLLYPPRQDTDISTVDRHAADQTFMQETVCVHAQTCSYPVGHVFMSWITAADGQDADHRPQSLTGSLICCLLSLTLPFTYSSYYSLPQPQCLPKPNHTVVIMHTCSTKKERTFKKKAINCNSGLCIIRNCILGGRVKA